MDNIGQSTPQPNQPPAGTPAAGQPVSANPDSAATAPVNAQASNQSSQTAQSPAQTQQTQSVSGMTNIMDALVLKGKITEEQKIQVMQEAAAAGVDPTDAVVTKGLVSSEDIVRTLAEMRNVGFVNLTNITIPPEVIKTIPKAIADAKSVVAFEKLPDGKIKVAMRDPLDLQTIQILESQLKTKIEPYYGVEEQIHDMINSKYEAQIGSEVDEALEEVGSFGSTQSTIGLTADTTSSGAGDAPIIRIVNMILDYGVKNRASDIHIEPRNNKVAVRFRISGFLTEKLTIPVKLLPSVVTRIKILSNLKIDEHRIPQDGRFQVKGSNGAVDIRVSIMPGIYGEKVVMRILTKSEGVLELDETGIAGISYTRLTKALKKTQGIVLVTGPTGSGKTQTLASSLKILNQPNVNVITLEDPVEIRVEGVNQTQVNSEVGLTFANGLRAILRQDPDIIMVGEIRDGETAGLAVQAALVGRLVLSTLHTNSAAGAFVRLIDMGVEPFLITSTVNLVMAQRLLRALGKDKKAYKASQKELDILHEALDPLGPLNITDKDNKPILKFDKNTTDVTLYEPVPSATNASGYKGRTAIFEALAMSETVGSLIVDRAPISKVQDQGIKEGMVTMAQDGFIKVLQGLTTIEEVLRVQNN